MKKKTKRKSKVRRDYKDRLFRMIFNEKSRLLELYNTMNGTAYDNPEELRVVTLENAIYMSMKDDVAFLLHEELVLFEHQSTYNPNMPLRFLFYVSDTYSMLVRDKNLYGTKRIPLPAPQFVVFYNGEKKCPEWSELRLSQSYQKKESTPSLELCVQVLNINLGYNEKLMEGCRSLKDYMLFVGKMRAYAAKMPLNDAVDQTIAECIAEDIMADFLRKNKAEVKKVCIYEYDEKRHIQMEREEAWEEGREEGREEGKKEGSIYTYIETCREFHVPDEQILSKLKIKFSLTDEEARNAMEL